MIVLEIDDLGKHFCLFVCLFVFTEVTRCISAERGQPDKESRSTTARAHGSSSPESRTSQLISKGIYWSLLVLSWRVMSRPLGYLFLGHLYQVCKTKLVSVFSSTSHTETSATYSSYITFEAYLQQSSILEERQNLVTIGELLAAIQRLKSMTGKQLQNSLKLKIT